MITGVVNADCEAVIRFRVYGPTGREHEVNASIDTGFNGFLTLLPALVSALEPTRLSRGRALLANSSEELFDIYGVTVLWDGAQQNVELDAAETTPLVGMSLLEGYDRHVQVAEGRRVVIQASREGHLSKRNPWPTTPLIMRGSSSKHMSLTLRGPPAAKRQTIPGAKMSLSDHLY
jgi:predicted aspartyl protease